MYNTGEHIYSDLDYVNSSVSARDLDEYHPLYYYDVQELETVCRLHDSLSSDKMHLENNVDYRNHYSAQCLLVPSYHERQGILFTRMKTKTSTSF
jgi:hypothetical protein